MAVIFEELKPPHSLHKQGRCRSLSKIRRSVIEAVSLRNASPGGCFSKEYSPEGENKGHIPATAADLPPSANLELKAGGFTNGY
jgi:hypothetical protein